MSKHVGRFLKLGLATAALIASSGFGAKNEMPKQKEVKVGAILPMTGKIATFGEESWNGLQLANEKLAGKGDLKLVLVKEDTKGEPKESAAAINKLIKTDKVSVVVGEVASSNTIAASGAAQSAKIPLMTHASTNDTITKGKEFISRICFIDSFQGFVMAKFAFEDLKAKTAAIMVDSDSDYSRGLKDSFTKAFTSMGGKIIVDVSYSQKDNDFKGPLGKVKSAKPDVVFVPGYYTQAGAILRQAKEMKIDKKFLGTDGWDSPELGKIAGKAAEGHFISSHFAPDDPNPKVQAFVSDYKAKFKTTPGAMAALAYDAAMYLHEAISQAKAQTPVEISKAITALKNFEGVTGKISLDADRNAVKPAAVLTIAADGTFKFKSSVYPVGMEPKAAEPAKAEKDKVAKKDKEKAPHKEEKKDKEGKK